MKTGFIVKWGLLCFLIIGSCKKKKIREKLEGKWNAIVYEINGQSGYKLGSHFPVYSYISCKDTSVTIPCSTTMSGISLYAYHLKADKKGVMFSNSNSSKSLDSMETSKKCKCIYIIPSAKNKVMDFKWNVNKDATQIELCYQTTTSTKSQDKTENVTDIYSYKTLENGNMELRRGNTYMIWQPE